MDDIAFSASTTLNWHDRPEPGGYGTLRIASGADAVLMHGVTHDEALLLRRLREPLSSSRFRALGERDGVECRRVDDLLEALATTTLLTTTPVPAGHLAIIGVGSIGLGTALGAVDCGLRKVSLVDTELVGRHDLGGVIEGYSPHDLGSPRTSAARTILTRQCPAVSVRPCDEVASTVDIAVVVGIAAIDPHVIAPLMSRDIPHLPVLLTGDGVSVGPVVRPGRGACLRCMNLHRRGIEPGWTTRAVQVNTAKVAPHLTRLAVAAAVTQLMAFMSAAEPLTTSVTLTLPHGMPSLVQWTRHPECGCG